MMKYLYLILFLLFPSIISALSQKECETYYQAANNEFKTAKNYFDQGDRLRDIEQKINHFNASIHHLFKAIENVNVIINYVNSVKKDKRKLWQRETREVSIKLQKDCCDSIQNLQN